MNNIIKQLVEKATGPESGDRPSEAYHTAYLRRQWKAG